MNHIPKTTLADGSPVTPEHREIGPDGLQKGYVVLSEAERAKGFVRPVRNSYVHVGLKPPGNWRDLTPEENERYKQFGYVKFEAYGEDQLPVTGKFWTAKDIEAINGCGTMTTMAQSIAETYARDPEFYGSTYCATCKTHRPVAEFVWDGTAEQVGS